MPPGSLATRLGPAEETSQIEISPELLTVCQLIAVINDGQHIDRVADTVTLQFRVSYSAVCYLFRAFEHCFLRQVSQV